MPSDPDLLIDGPADASMTIILAHGAGAAMDTPFMNFFATGLADRVVRFEFPYMASKRSTGKGKPPDREPGAADDMAQGDRDDEAVGPKGRQPGDRRQVNGRQDRKLDRG